MSWESAFAQGGSSLLNDWIGYYYDRKLMAKQFEYQKEVLQNQNQWRVEDLKKAGLNPILATGITANASSGVSIPSGKKSNIDMLGAMSTAKQMKLVDQQTQTEKQRTNTEAENGKYVTAQTIKAQAEARLISEQTITAQLENRLRTLNLGAQEQQALLAKAQAMFDLEWDELWKIQRFANSAESVVDAIPFGKFAGQAIDYLLGKSKVKPTLRSRSIVRTQGKYGFTQHEKLDYDR